MSLNALSSAVVASIEANVSTFHAVQTHGGRFSAAEIQRLAVKSPACLVANMGGRIERKGAQAYCDAVMIAFVLSRGTSTEIRNAAAAGLCESVAGLANENKWAYENARAPRDMAIGNLYTGDVDKLGVALWSVSWKQLVEIAPFDASTLDDFHSLYVDYDLPPADGVVDSQQAIDVWGELMSAYGNINVSTPVATVIAVADTYQKAAGTTGLNLADTMDMPADGRLRHTGTTAKPFLVSASASVTTSVDAKITLALAKNSTVDTDTEIEQQITAAGGAEAFPLKHIVSLDTNDHIEVWVKSDTQPCSVTLTKLTVTAAAT